MKFLTIPAVAVVLSLSAAPALANKHDGDHHKRGGHHFTKMDTNKDGVITRAEFTAKTNKMFDKMDANKDGKITKAEGKAAKAEWRKKHKGMKGDWKKKKGMHHKRGDMKRDDGMSNSMLRGENDMTRSRVIKR